MSKGPVTIARRAGQTADWDFSEAVDVIACVERFIVVQNRRYNTYLIVHRGRREP
jgi:N-formylglutamate amidohydrolase